MKSVVLSPSVTLTLGSRSYQNNLIYDANMSVLYCIDQEGVKLFGTSPIHVYRVSPEKGRMEHIALVEFHTGKDDLITYREVTQKLQDMFPRREWHNPCVCFSALFLLEVLCTLF